MAVATSALEKSMCRKIVLSLGAWWCSRTKEIANALVQVARIWHRPNRRRRTTPDKPIDWPRRGKARAAVALFAGKAEQLEPFLEVIAEHRLSQ